MIRHLLAFLLATLVFGLSTAPATAQKPGEGKRYALLVGVEWYEHPELRKPAPLKYSVDDVSELAKVLKQAGYDVTLLCDDTGKQDRKLVPSKKNIEGHLKRILRDCGSKDTVLVACTGHGLQFVGQEDAYFCPVDARPFADETDSLVSITTIYGEFKKSFAGVKMILVDACRNDPDPGRGRGLDADSAPRPPNGVAALFSCSAGQRAFEHDDLKHGVFFHYVLEGLKGKAADASGEVPFESLAVYVRRQVPAAVRRLFPNQRQYPNLKADLTGVPPIVLSRSTMRPKSASSKGLLGSLPGEEWSDNSLGMKFCWCPPGSFTMGSPPDEPNRGDDEDQVRVTLTRGFWLGKYEVTQSEYERVMGTNPSWFSSGGLGNEKVSGMDTRRFPVEQVSWDDASEFCRKLTSQERRAGKLPAGWKYDLPTEAQWEYACRAGTTTATAFGDSLSSTQANFNGDVPYIGASKGPNLDRTCTVGSYGANRWGLHDLHGNVWEWCRDWYKDDLPGGRDPEITAFPEKRVLRGGGWYNFGFCRSAIRGRYLPGLRLNFFGFRVARVPE